MENYINKHKDELFAYSPPLTKRPDFDEFWKETVEIARSVELMPTRQAYDYPVPFVKVYTITYYGFDNTKIHGWFMVPDFDEKSKYPCLIHYHGFPGNSGFPSLYLQWIMMGVAVLAIDLRDQNGRTGNCASYSSGSTQNVMCKGLLDKEEYYYRAVYMDCVKAIDFACSQPEADHRKIIVEGASQGGSLSMSVCALDSRPVLCMVDVPGFNNLEKRIEAGVGSDSGITGYLQAHPDCTEQVLETLSYFDNMNLADRIRCPVFASVGLRDTVCPAKLYFSAYNRIRSRKEIRIYPFNGHEGGGVFHNELKLKYLKEYLLHEN